jgi:stalled ribosome rescue protein Dom34
MTTSAGIWIDHRRAVIVVVSEGRESASEIRSNVESQPGRVDGVRSTAYHEDQLMKADDSRDREFMGHLNKYYAEVMAAIPAVDAILLFGPGEAKGELKKRLEHAKVKGLVIATETADKLTHRQIVAKVHEYHRDQPAAPAPREHSEAKAR